MSPFGAVKLVLLHPLPLDATMWPADVTSLAPGDVVAPTLYDAGDDLIGWARHVIGLAGDGAEPLVLVGNSVGGSCAIEVARLAGPARVRAIVLSGAKAGHDAEPAFRDEALRVIAEEGIDAAWDRYWRPLFGPDADPAVVERARSIARSQGAERVAAGVRAFHGRPDRDGFLDSWPGPVWVVSGEHDVRPARARTMAARLARGQHREVRGAGHYVPIEAPEAFAAVVAEALRA